MTDFLIAGMCPRLVVPDGGIEVNAMAGTAFPTNRSRLISYGRC